MAEKGHILKIKIPFFGGGWVNKKTLYKTEKNSRQHIGNHILNKESESLIWEDNEHRCEIILNVLIKKNIILM